MIDQNPLTSTSNPQENFFKKLKNITTFIFDVDGVLTDGSIQATDSGELLRTFNIKDGYALQLAVKKGYHVCVISGGSGIAMQHRFSKLGIKHIHLGAGDKVEVFKEFITNYTIDPQNIVYMGDDMPDLEIMKLVGLPCCPADAVAEIKEISGFISPYNGGKTAARDIIEKVMKIQGKWLHENPLASDSGK